MVELSFVLKYSVKYGNWKIAKVSKLLESEFDSVYWEYGDFYNQMLSYKNANYTLV